jgi:uncharacterized protein YbjT (DUF2867 family)
MILVTGASGFLGRHLIRRLIAVGEPVRCVVRPGSPGLEWLRSQGVEVAVTPLWDQGGVALACRGARRLVHLAAPIREVRDAVVGQFHRQGTACLVGGARAAGVDRFLMVSPLGSGKSSSQPFLRSCGVAEEFVRESGLPFVALQSSLMFGAGDRLIGGMIRLLRRTGLLVVAGTGKTMLQPIWVGDVVSCLLRALCDDDLLDRILPIGGPQHLTYEEVADQVGKMINLPQVKVHLSPRVASLAARMLEALGHNPFPGYRHLELLEVGSITAPDAVKRTFGFQPMPLIEGVAYQMTPPNEVGRIRPPSPAERGSKSRGRR